MTFARRLATCAALVSLSTFSASASTIFGASTTTSTGLTYTVTVTADDTTGADMVGIQITALFTDGQSFQCTWNGSGTCSSAGNEFTVSYPSGDSTHPITNNSNWVVSNTRTGFSLQTLTVNGIPGLVAFDRCMTGGSTFNDTNPTGGLGCFGGTGTANSNIGFSVGSGNGSANGGNGTPGITGTVEYRNALHLAASSSVGDLWGQFTITFGGTAFTSGSTFTFRSDSDELGSAVLDGGAATPEPSTFAMLGAALLGLGVTARRRRS